MMHIPKLTDPREGKVPQYNAKTTRPVSVFTLRDQCALSNAYMESAVIAQGKATRHFEGIEVPTDSSHTIVAVDNLTYGVEIMLKAAMMVDGYNGLNKNVELPRRVANFEDPAGMIYVYVVPTHRLDELYEYLSTPMKEALCRVCAPVSLTFAIDLISRTAHPKSQEDFWAPGVAAPNRKQWPKFQNVVYDSPRYRNNLIRSLSSNCIHKFVYGFRRINGALPNWLGSRTLELSTLGPEESV